MSSIEIDDSRFDPTVRKLGLVAGLLETAGAGKVRFLLDWFNDPMARLRETPNRRGVLLALLREQLGGDPIAPGKNQGWSWYPLDRDALPNGVFVVLPEKDDAGPEAVIGVGLRARTEGANGSVDCYVHIPLFTIPPKTNPLIVGDDQHPIRIWIDGVSKGGDVTVRLTGEVRFSAAPTFKLEVKVKSLEALAKSLEELRADPVRAVIKALLDSDVMKEWLARKVGTTGLTVSAFLEAIHILAKGGDGKWELAKLDQFNGASALQIAQIAIADMLNVIAETKKPVVTFKGGGLSIVRRDAEGGAKDFGFRVAAPDITTRKSDKTAGLVVHVGKWLSGEDDKSAWVHRDGFDPKSAIKENGLIAMLLRVTTSGTSRTFAFRPAIEMASIGFDAVGPKGKPLVDVNGFTLGALEVRYYFRTDFSNPAVSWGGAVRCRNIGVPLGGGTATTAIANPVVQNLLSAGKQGKGSDNKPVNPTFSASVARILRGEPTQMAVWLDATNGAGSENEVAFPVQSSFGPLKVTRVTIRWPKVNPNQVLTFALDASVTIEALNVALAGFAVGIPLGSAGTFSTYSFDLAGLGISFEAPPIAIQAALVSSKDAKGVTRYDGKAVIRAKNWSIAALGSYTVIDGAPSMFLFGFFRSAMGGPPFCFVTGVCAGFGYNRALRLPDRDKVNEFPLLAALDDPKAIGGENATPDQAMKKLNDGKWIEPSHGSHWLAAGLQFTTYQIVKTNAILFILFGNRNELTLLGVSRLRLPQNDEARTFAYAELGIQATLDLDSGFFGVSAILSPNSYVLTPDCHLTGGFAFFAWLGREHNGDFVLTLGGYHPAFTIPAHYPRVPRLGFSWQVNDSITISGEAYFALTPTCAMGGGMLQVQYHSGNLRAWFVARADFLLQWKPFYYSGRVAVSIGASYRLNLLVTTTTVSAELGASLEIWGPPTGGRVEVDWYVISFGVSFGAPPKGPAAITWDQFDQLLPQKRSAKALPGAPAGNDTDPVTISFSDASSKSGDKWIIRPATLQIAVSTVIPATEVAVGAKVLKPEKEKYSSICVRAMKQCDVTSTLKITLTQDGGAGVAIDKWNSAAVYGGVPEGMWGQPIPGEKAPPPDAKVLPDRLLGIEKLEPPKPQLTGPDAFPQSRVAYEPVLAPDGTRLAPFLPLRSDAPSIKRQPRVDNDRVNVIANTIASPAAQQRRAELVALFGEFGIERNDPMSVMKTDAKTLFAAAPLAGSTEVTQ